MSYLNCKLCLLPTMIFYLKRYKQCVCLNVKQNSFHQLQKNYLFNMNVNVVVTQLTVSIELSERKLSIKKSPTAVSQPGWLAAECLGENRKVFFPFPVVRLAGVLHIQSCCRHLFPIKDQKTQPMPQLLKILFLPSIAFSKVKVSRKLSQIKGTVNMDFIVTDRCTQFYLFSKIFLKSKQKV